MKHIIIILTFLLITPSTLAQNKNGLSSSESLERVGIKVLEVSFGSVDANNNVIINYGDSLLASDIRYLTTRIKYVGTDSIIKAEKFKVKIISPQGKVIKGLNSPEGYSSLELLGIFPKEEITCELKTIGNGKPWYESVSGYCSGNYQWQLYDGVECIYNKDFIVYDGSKYDTPYELLKGDWRKQMAETFNKLAEKEKEYENIELWLNCYGIRWKNNSRYYWGATDRTGSSPESVGLMMGDGYESIDIKGVKNCMYLLGRFIDGKLSDTNDGLFFRTGTYGFDSNGKQIINAYFKKGKIIKKYSNDDTKFRCFRYEDGFYVGCSRYGLPHGYGVFLWNDGGVFLGNWSYGEPLSTIDFTQYGWKGVDYEERILQWSLKTPISR